LKICRMSVFMLWNQPDPIECSCNNPIFYSASFHLFLT
jgi:hypothetical protein